MKLLVALAPFMALSLTACDKQTAPPGGDPNTQAADSTAMASAASAATNDCAKIQTTEWQATIDGMPGPNKPTVRPLDVSGKAHLTEGGWTLSLVDRGQTKNIPYTQMLEFVATKSGDVSILPVEDRVVTFTNPVPGQVGKVTISCGRMQIAVLEVERPQ